MERYQFTKIKDEFTDYVDKDGKKTKLKTGLDKLAKAKTEVKTKGIEKKVKDV